MDLDQYLEGVKKQFWFYKVLSEKALSQLSDTQLKYQFNPTTNSIAILVKHISGNLISRWTDFLNSDGEKPWRNRDQEFIEDFPDRVSLLNYWQAAWNLLEKELNTLNVDDLKRKVYIRNQAHTVPDALHRQLSHIAYHVGQIVHQAKILLGESWQTLSIPQGQSEQFITERMTKGKREGHFTDEYFKKK